MHLAQDQHVHFHFPFPSLVCIDSPCHLSIHTFPLALTSSFTLSARHHHLPPPSAPLPVFLFFCIAFPPSPSHSRSRSPNTLTLLQISVGSTCIQTTPPAFAECIRSSHRTSPILLFVFCSLPCTITPFPSTKRGHRSQIFPVLSPSLLIRLSHSQAVFRTPSLSPRNRRLCSSSSLHPILSLSPSIPSPLGSASHLSRPPPIQHIPPSHLPLRDSCFDKRINKGRC